MENEIKIKVPEDKKAVQSTDDNGNIVIKFENAEPIRSKSWEEFCKKHSIKKNECYLSHYGTIIKYYNVNGCRNRDIDEDKHLLETEKYAEGILALIQLTRLHDEWVGDWKKTCGHDAAKIFRLGNNEIAVECTYDNALLQFPTEGMAQEFLNCFKDLLEKAKKFI